MNTVEPIRDLARIDTMKKILKASSVRNYLLFTLGINTGLRISDLLPLKVGDICDEKGRPLDMIQIREKKTGKEKTFMLNRVVKKAIQEYIEACEYNRALHVFKSRKGNNQPISRFQAWEILNSAARAVGIKEKIGTHTLRKTFGYHAYRQGNDITLLMRVFNHAAPSTTLRYIGITQDDINDVYVHLNL